MSKELKGKLLELFKKIEHGDYEHRKWLYDEILKFQEEEESTDNICKDSCCNMSQDYLESIFEGWREIDKLREEFRKEEEFKASSPPLLGANRVSYQWSGSFTYPKKH